MHTLFNGFRIGSDRDLGILWLFVRRVDPSKILYLTCARFFVKLLRISLLADRQGRGHEDLDEVYSATQDNLPRPETVDTIRRNERGDDDEACVGHELRHFGYTPDVLDPIVRIEAKICVQAMSNIVPVQNVDLHLPIEQFAFEPVR